MTRLGRIRIWSWLPGGRSRGTSPETKVRITVRAGKGLVALEATVLGSVPWGQGGKEESRVLADEPLSTLCRKGSKDEGGRKVGDSKWVTAGEARYGVCGQMASTCRLQLLILPPPWDPELAGPFAQ